MQSDSFCNILHKNYDIRDIEKFRGGDIKKHLFDVAEKVESEQKKGKDIPCRKALVKLVNNYRLNKTPTPRYIEGPISMTKHTSEFYGIEIYIFGERHGEYDRIDKKTRAKMNEEGGVIKIHNLIKQLTLNSHTFFDLFLEAAIQEKSIDNDTSIYKILREVQKCFLAKERCIDECMLSRLHYIDVRDDKEGKPIHPIGQIEDILFNKSVIYHDNNDYDEKEIDYPSLVNDLKGGIFYNKILDIILSNDNQKLKKEKLINIIWGEFLSDKAIKKQLKKTYLIYDIQEFIRSGITNYVNLYWENMSKNLILINNKDLNCKKFITENLSGFSVFILKINALTETFPMKNVIV